MKCKSIVSVILMSALMMTSVATPVCADEVVEDLSEAVEIEAVEEVAEETMITDAEETEADAFIDIVKAGDEIAGVEQANIASAPTLEIGKTYSYRYNGSSPAHVAFPFSTDIILNSREYLYFKYEVTKAGKYAWKFQASCTDYLQAMSINRSDETGKIIYDDGKEYWVNTNSFYTHEIGPKYLEPGTYYITLKVATSGSTGDAACGNIWFGEYGSTYTDPQYNESETINDNTVEALKGSIWALNAPRIAIGSEYTFTSYDDYNANLIYLNNTKFLYKVLVTEPAQYKFSAEVTGDKAANLEIFDSNYKYAVRNVNGQWKNQKREYTVDLDKGAYYISIFPTYGAKGKIKLEKLGVPTGSGDLLDGTEKKSGTDNFASKDDTVKITKDGKKYLIKPEIKGTAAVSDTVTIYKGNTIYLDPSLEATELQTSDKKFVAVSKKGSIKGKKAGNATVTYKVGDTTHTLKVVVVDGKVSARDTACTVKGSAATAKIGSEIRIKIILPMNVEIEKFKNDGVVENLKVSTAKDAGEIWISGTAAKKGSASITFKVNGKKVTAKIKVKK